MRNPITSAPKFLDFGSFDKIATKLLVTQKDVFRNIKERSLGAKIGDLNRGKVSWWAKQPEAIKCLAEFLDIDPNELGLHQKTGRHVFSFSVFPDLPPLDLLREDYWTIAQAELISNSLESEGGPYHSKPNLDFWLAAEPRGFGGNKIEWLHIPDNLEYQLQTSKLAALGRHDMVARKSLRDVLDIDSEQLHRQQPLIVAIQIDAQYEEVQELDWRHQGTPLLIISPLPLPVPDPQRKYGMNEGNKPEIQPKVNEWIWTLLPKWREHLLEWVERRFNKLSIDTLFSSQATQGLLNKFDPGRKWFVSVNDVLVLCQAVSEARERKLNAATGSDTDVTLLLSLLFNRDESSLHLIQPLIEARWKRWDLAWAGELPQEDWMDMSKELCPFHTMLTQQVIMHGKEGYDFQRPIVMRLLLRSYLIKQLSNGKLASWTPACFDSERRPLVDAALDAVSITELEVVAAQLMQAPTTVETIGACEALYAAIGRRIIRKEYIGNELPAIAGLVFKLHKWPDEMLTPWSRPLFTPAERLEWISVCWAWSLQSAPNVDKMPSNWLFPGWSTDLPKKLPDWLSNYDSRYSARSWEKLAVPMQEFLSVLERWLANTASPVDYENAPSVLNAGLLIRAARGDWSARLSWWEGIIGNPAAEQALLSMLESEDDLKKECAALVWWPSLVEFQREKSRNSLSFNQQRPGRWTDSPNTLSQSVVMDWVMGHLSQNCEKALNALKDDERNFLTSYPASLSIPLKKELLKALAKNLPSNLHPWQLGNFLSRYGREAVMEMEEFLGDSQLGREAAWCIWEWAPRRAEYLLRKKQTLPKSALRNLILNCPTVAIGTAITLLNDDPQLLLDDERLQWVRMHIPNARQHAKALMELT